MHDHRAVCGQRPLARWLLRGSPSFRRCAGSASGTEKTVSSAPQIGLSRSCSGQSLCEGFASRWSSPLIAGGHQWGLRNSQILCRRGWPITLNDRGTCVEHEVPLGTSHNYLPAERQSLRSRLIFPPRLCRGKKRRQFRLQPSSPGG